MAVNQPPLEEDTSPAVAAWELELTQEINRLEQQVVALLAAIQSASSLADLKSRTEDL